MGGKGGDKNATFEKTNYTLSISFLFVVEYLNKNENCKKLINSLNGVLRK